MPVALTLEPKIHLLAKPLFPPFMSALTQSAHSWLDDLVVYEPGKPIEETARELGLQPSDIIKLASNENPLGPSPKAIGPCARRRHRCTFIPTGRATN